MKNNSRKKYGSPESGCYASPTSTNINRHTAYVRKNKETIKLGDYNSLEEAIEAKRQYLMDNGNKILKFAQLVSQETFEITKLNDKRESCVLVPKDDTIYQADIEKIARDAKECSLLYYFYKGKIRIHQLTTI